MKRIKAIKGSDLILKFAAKSLISSLFSVLAFSAVTAYICLKTDIDVSYISYFSVALCAIASAVSGWISVLGFKNNGFLLGIISTIPLIIFSFINLIIHSNSAIIFLIKLFICAAIGGIFGYASVKKSKRIKVR